MSYMGLDVGQTGCKAVIFNENGDQCALSYREYETIVPREGWAELDSKGVKKSCFTVMKEAQHHCQDDPVEGLAISTQGEAFTPIGPRGECLSNAMITFDTRASRISERWTKEFGIKKLYHITGHTAHPMFTLFKLLWLKENKKALFQKAVKFLCFEDFIQHALGIEPHISWSLAGRTMMFNVLKHDWEDEILKSAGILRSQLSQPVQSGVKLGNLPIETARSLGFSNEVVVASGGHDQPLGALGAGVTTTGRAMYATGTSECIAPVISKPVLNETMLKNNLCTYDYVIEGMYLTIVYSLTGGNILKWFRDEWGQIEVREAGQAGKNVYEILLQKIDESPSGILVLPYFTPSGTPYFETAVPGVIIGLRLSTKREQVLRALLEGVAFEMRLNLDILSQCGVEIEELRTIGGGAKSKIWSHIKADVLNKPITTVQVTEAACLAAAMLACLAHTDEPVESIVKRWVKTDSVILPDRARAEFYTHQFEKYKMIYPSIKGIFQQ